MVGLTEERSAQIVRQSGNARNIVFLAVIVISLFIPVYWFYENGIPAVGAEGRLAHEKDVQYVTDVERGYELFRANCATCHGDNGQGGVGPTPEQPGQAVQRPDRQRRARDRPPQPELHHDGAGGRRALRLR